jgi:hypothetical protein
LLFSSNFPLVVGLLILLCHGTTHRRPLVANLSIARSVPAGKSRILKGIENGRHAITAHLAGCRADFARLWKVGWKFIREPNGLASLVLDERHHRIEAGHHRDLRCDARAAV